jgi:hypothetical protein
MRVLSIVVAIELAGCITKNVSTIGPLVREIQLDPSSQGLVVDRCEVRAETTRNYMWIWLGQNHTRTRELLEGDCQRAMVPMGGL